MSKRIIRLKEKRKGSAKITDITNLAASTDITAVPASFADLAAVRTYLAGANVVPNVEARLDALETKVNAMLTALRSAGILG
jgi:hypothetical protein